MGVTIRDVAEAAGVSIATVSRSLRNHSNISEETRNKVQTVATELGYKLPQRNGGSKPTIKKIAIVVPFIGRWYFAQIIEGIESVMRERGIESVVFRPSSNSGEPLSIYEHLEHFGIQGVILVSKPMSEMDMAYLYRKNIPTVLIDMLDKRFTSVAIDDITVGRIATDHLINLGHQRIGMVSSDPNDPDEFSTPNHRREGFLQALKAAGIEFNPNWHLTADFTARSADAAVRGIFATGNMPTAIFAASDEMAIGVMGAARRMGLKVPQDISVIGVDNHDIAESVGLTTVGQPIDAIPEVAAWQLISRMEDNSEPPGKFVLPVQLIVRESTASLRTVAV